MTMAGAHTVNADARGTLVSDGTGSQRHAAPDSPRSPRGRTSGLLLLLFVLAHVWFFGLAAVVAPWTKKQSALRESNVEGCVHLVATGGRWLNGSYFEGEERRLAVARIPCGQVDDLPGSVALALANERAMHPRSTYKLQGRPFTTPLLREATSNEKAMAFFGSLLVTAGGIAFVALGTWLTFRLWRRTARAAPNRGNPSFD